MPNKSVHWISSYQEHTHMYVYMYVYWPNETPYWHTMGAPESTGAERGVILTYQKRVWSDTSRAICSKMCSSAILLDANRAKCVSYVFRSALARHQFIQMSFLCAQTRSRSTPVEPKYIPCVNSVFHSKFTLSRAQMLTVL